MNEVEGLRDELRLLGDELADWADENVIGSPAPIHRPDRAVARAMRDAIALDVARQARADGFTEAEARVFADRVAVHGELEGDAVVCRIFRPRIGIVATMRVR